MNTLIIVAPKIFYITILSSTAIGVIAGI